jgi:hypothetical protein
VLLIKRGDTVTGLQRLSTAVSGLRDIGYAVYYVAFMGELAEALGRARQTAHGLATIDEALARSERSEERWCVAELLRIKGELVILQGPRGQTERQKNISGSRSTGRVSKRFSRGSYALPPASPDCCAISAVSGKRGRCGSRPHFPAPASITT